MILSLVTAVAVFSGGGLAAGGVDAVATVYDPDSRVLAEGSFHADGDRFELTKRARGDGRAYLEYRYLRKDGSLQTGTHWGSGTIGAAVAFDHDFGEQRKVMFRVCVEFGHLCSAGTGGENWSIGYA